MFQKITAVFILRPEIRPLSCHIFRYLKLCYFEVKFLFYILLIDYLTIHIHTYTYAGKCSCTHLKFMEELKLAEMVKNYLQSYTAY